MRSLWQHAEGGLLAKDGPLKGFAVAGADKKWVHASADRVNFAKYQTVTASGQRSTYGPDFAVDGIASNFLSFRTNNTSNPQWLEVRFPRAVMIGSAHLYLGLDNVNDPTKDGLAEFKLQYHDGSNWLDIPGALVTGM